MTSAGPICASCKQLGHSRGSNFSYSLSPRHKTLLIPQKRTSDNLSAQEEYQAESTVQNSVVLTVAEINALSCAAQYSAEGSRAAASKPRAEAVQSHVMLTIAEKIALSRAAKYPAESDSAAASKPRVEAVQSRVVLTIAEIIALSRAAQYPAESSRAAASRPRVEAVWDFVVPTQLLSIDLSFTEQYTAESDRDLTDAFEALQVSDVERVLDLTTTIATATTTVIPHCSSCNGIGHQQSNSLQCPNNQRDRNFVPGQLTTTHNIAWHTTTSAMIPVLYAMTLADMSSRLPL
ncbi:hypothetical protein PHYBLDRAFT_69623 [Phycomyces blakesleeanus NRRL 1555(-)]|uniref:Uncharacterized protein n=1 Tax=Phycomyces blakesleeanus (strain ATCC 8743b / DSM 1359 / FGSC 10004 / NBRC 33097 / NRRL 1555) TaxID=763407 RepID=A0A167LIL5_PHYB8|nr:hypothetical protein PHYBLDRAFT_69623 [Phycomyces blakesleeanus NRRL 1555(-)]OAD70547.1 hypothetical protein PHYBLDRAFT_69623 [Phycomyces blakesleeanus NRRL 1555(-)]|eukprot:XP_018288587.1 hypothetical protein PHYBLDRAFT_69623 [Phycomyces blakesleeanus NRRL 1555(-)]